MRARALLPPLLPLRKRAARLFLSANASAAAAPPPAPPTCLHLTYTCAPVLTLSFSRHATTSERRRPLSDVADVLERRGPHRPAHLAAAKAHLDAGRLLLAGAFVDAGPPGAVFVWAPSATREQVDAFVASDPYVLNGLVTRHDVRSWAVPLSSPALQL